MAPQTLLLIGATSDIGRAIALRFAAAGWRLQFAARDLDEAARTADDVAARTGAAATLHRLDILEDDAFPAFLDGLPALPDAAVCVVGLLGDQARGEIDPAHARLVLRSNFEGPALLLGAIATRFSARGTGAIIGVSSVAGERGRGSNYLYGAAKAGFTAFLSGLRNRLAPRGIRVITVKPGFVRTRMTAHLKLPPLLTATPDDVAKAVAAAMAGRRDVVYARPVWRLVMTLVRLLPEPLFKRLKL
ncbi:SDR family oxidoreductase [Aquabacter spiritensis]|uniref:Short-subunit dehydrogenase n=1 Tax=Aquabacter spiritensis TaxID=933073 RepID=A0A4R3LNV8_9HYPH|nr:SDR family oxidoreductase [Aquabacter spiritensis]TCT02153.1 short-subunit dehydrogenase [Aquabacter spiritensis]